MLKGVPQIHLHYLLATWTKVILKNEKKNLAAALISNCRASSKRLEFINELKKYMNVDVYGKCGSHLCPSNTNCREFINRKYKFFFAFENSMCQDYVTEKFFQTLNYDIVPVVLGLGNYSYYVG